MKKHWKFLLIVFLCAALLMVGLTAASAEIADSGTCGADLRWTLDGTGLLTITGTGGMTDYSEDDPAPWGTDITGVVIENGAASIGSYAFCWCAGLSGVIIPGSVATIGDWAFGYCDGLTAVSLPEGVAYINDCAFMYCCNLADVILPDSLTSIGNDAFSGCYGLTGITIPDSVGTIGYAFRFCCGLTSILVSENSAAFASYADALYDKARTVLIQYPCGKTTAVLAEGVLDIGEYAFGGCDLLTSVTLPSSVLRLGEHAFDACTSLSAVTVPSSVYSIGDYAFDGCSSLASVTIPESVTSIGNYAFSDCPSLTLSVYLKSAGLDYAKANSIPYTILVNPETVNTLFLPTDLTTIEAEAFAGAAFEAVIVQEGCQSIGAGAFDHCPHLIYVRVPAGTAIHDTAFAGCDDVTIDRMTP